LPASESRLDRSEAEQTSDRNALLEANLRFRTLADAFPHMVWSTLPDGFHDYYNARWYEFTGVPEGSTDGEAWAGMFHPDDQERAWERWRNCLRTGEPYEIEYRLRHKSGDYRWVLGRAMPMHDQDGQIVRWMGTCTDIHEQKETAEQNEILGRELSHRIKNIFSVIGGLIGLSARRQPEHREFANELQGRISALGRAHELVRPHSEQSRPQVETESLRALLADVLCPYPAMAEGRIRIAGDDVRIDDRGATPIALLIHELATNALKYGSLSLDTGYVDIGIYREDDCAVIDWMESEGPPVDGEPAHAGFGTRLAEMSVIHQLGGTLVRQWHPGGLHAQARVRLKALAR
jgi:PAS domain S-box-containing protein